MKKLISIILVIILFVFSVSAQAYDTENIRSKALYMISKDDGQVIFAYNENEELSMASITKIMTYIVAVENFDDIENTYVEVPAEIATILQSTYSSLSGVKEGEKLTILELLHLMLIPSGNDAALVLAMYYDSLYGEYHEYTGVNENGVDTRATDMSYGPFVQLMNEKAQELGCYNTSFSNPHGLNHEDNYSTAEDLAIIARYASELPYFSEIVAMKQYTLRATNVYDSERTVSNTNLMYWEDRSDGMYYYEYADGMKTGSLTQSGFCIAASATKDDRSLIAVALGANYPDTINGAILDVKDLFEWAFSNVVQVATKDEIFSEIEVEYCLEYDSLPLAYAENLEILFTDDIQNVETVLSVSQNLQAPISQGEVVGKVDFVYNGEVLGSVDVISALEIEKNAQYVTLEKDTILGSTQVDGAFGDVDLALIEDVELKLPIDAAIDDVEIFVEIAQSIEVPFSQDDILATASLKYDGQEVANAKLFPTIELQTNTEIVVFSFKNFVFAYKFIIVAVLSACVVLIFAKKKCAKK